MANFKVSVKVNMTNVDGSTQHATKEFPIEDDNSMDAQMRAQAIARQMLKSYLNNPDWTVKISCGKIKEIAFQ